MIRIVVGNIVDSNETYICHQVNCQNAMGAGVAKALYEKWPLVKSEYHEFCGKHHAPVELLGAHQLVSVGDDKWVINIFGQLEFGRNKNKVYTDYVALEKVFAAISQLDGSFAFPFGIGCGLANGDWNIVYSLIEKYFSDKDVVLYSFLK
ncbi:MAG: macro domain-containing protein [Lachnospiraceae bacterium]|nr:macro domain-containing protein [Lachnospiraceae bacterium]